MTELFQRIPEEKQLRILHSAINEFAEFGYEHANTNRIARAAGISVGSLFKYFDSKEDLFTSTVKFGAAELKNALRSLAEGPGDEDVFDKVERVLRTVQQHSRQNVSLIRLYNEMTAHSAAALVLQEVDWIESFTATLYAQLIEKAKADGVVRPDCDARMFAFLLDNLFMSLQFSYTCGYYMERFKVYVSSDILQRDDFVIEQTMKFIRSAFSR
ncbi:MAG: TetR/AcrR family transcriptional regulator [Oscillospiraceae bacterium]|jgi:AcrR family transcriptional regulator|nr:TetR/AcrR family transcriptional regulator [Oscillospiraceae bacterium]